MMILTTFFRTYRKIFTDETLIEAEYICQQSLDIKEKFPTDESRLKEAQRLVCNYAEAALVVTSRIHCALPCLGLGTPVIYTEDSCQSEASACRLDGLRQLFNIAKWQDGRLLPEWSFSGKISSIQNIPINKPDWKGLAQRLQKRVANFIEN